MLLKGLEHWSDAKASMLKVSIICFLTRRLSQRPTKSELQQRNILPNDSAEERHKEREKVSYLNAIMYMTYTVAQARWHGGLATPFENPTFIQLLFDLFFNIFRISLLNAAFWNWSFNVFCVCVCFGFHLLNLSVVFAFFEFQLSIISIIFGRMNLLRFREGWWAWARVVPASPPSQRC